MSLHPLPKCGKSRGTAQQSLPAHLPAAVRQGRADQIDQRAPDAASLVTLAYNGTALAACRAASKRLSVLAITVVPSQAR